MTMRGNLFGDGATLVFLVLVFVAISTSFYR
jgi:hypothetical protein